MEIKDKLLEDGEYYKEICEKTTLVLHHTAGSHRPDYTVDSWEHDRGNSGGQLPVGTAYIIGGKSTTLGDANQQPSAFDGLIYRAFDDKYWAHHIGLKASNNTWLNQRSIGIEVCNYGPCTKTKDGIFLNYIGKPVPADMVYELPQKWRGFTHYHKYTEKQLESLKWLIKDICKRHPKIDPKKGIQELLLGSPSVAFEVSLKATSGLGGIWTHVNYRSDKSDMSPYPPLVELLKSL